MSILIALLIFVVIVWVAFWILGQMQLPQPIRMIATIIVGLIALMALYRTFGSDFDASFLR